MIKRSSIFQKSIIILKKRWTFLLFLIPFVSWVLMTYQDFGISIDEPIEYSFGEMLYARNFGKDPQLIRDFAVEGKDSREIWAYNHFHTMLLFMVNDEGSIEIYHLLNLLFSIVAFYAAYEIIYQLTKNPLLGLVGPTVLFFTPRLLGDIAANVKDPVFATYYLIALLAIIVTRHQHWFPRGLILGLAFGLAAAFRVLGYSLLIIYVLDIVTSHFVASKKNQHFSWVKIIPQTMIIFCLMITVHAVQMPFVASNPIANFPRLLSLAARYPWQGELLYLGNIINSINLPWHYPLVWFGVSTPIFIIMFSILSHIFYKNNIIRLLLISVWVNVGLYVIIQPNIYDGIRHYLFLQVILALLAAAAWSKLWLKSTRKIRSVLIAVLLIYISVTSYQYLNLHPYEYVYFNQLTGSLPGASQRFETDYWGLSYKEAAENLDVGSESIIGICGNKAAQIYFSEKNIETIWLPDCDPTTNTGVKFVIANARNGDWKKIRGNTVYEVDRMSVPLVKVISLSIN